MEACRAGRQGFMEYAGIKHINELVQRESIFVQKLISEIGKVIVGQRYLVERLLIGLLSDGHILIERVPELAKTMSVRMLAQTIHTDFQRLQFTPDLLPADLIGTLIYNPKEGNFFTKKGPIFSPSAVITLKGAPVRYGPGETEVEAFLLHEGTKVVIIEEKDNWYQIQLPDGKTGWLPKDSIEWI